ncbi:MAG: aspartate aminotransferase family protein [Planctomycetaceae bacterium]|nr:MAG: aspartate aminotransferase family protein [Planctomycetaceae bacterium]
MPSQCPLSVLHRSTSTVPPKAIVSRTHDPAETQPSLDPEDWQACRDVAHKLLDSCLEHLQNIRDRPWREFPEGAMRATALEESGQAIGLEATADKMVREILPYGSGNTHPAFFGWVQGTGTVAGLLAEMVAATMNSNCGGRNHGAVYIEREVIAWCRDRFGLPAGASGVLVTGTSQATLIGLAVARQRALGATVRRTGVRDAPQLTAYAVEGVHQATIKAIELLGLGSDNLRLVPRSPRTFGMCPRQLVERIRSDRQSGGVPFCVIGTSGSVDTGSHDPLNAIADICAEQQLWLHVDGAFGAWLRIADPPYRDLVAGIDRADSLAFDFHKWMSVQYDCGIALLRDGELHRATFSSESPYLRPRDTGLGAGGPWFCDYGIDLSRGFRALKVWATLQAYGEAVLGETVSRNCHLAALMGDQIERSAWLRLVSPVISNVCCFTADPSRFSSLDPMAVNEAIAIHFQQRGGPILSITRVDGRHALRAAVVNHRTTREDVIAAIAAVEAYCESLPRSGPNGPAAAAD